MREEVLFAKRQHDWNRLYQLSLDARRSLRRIPAQDLEEMVRLYRRASGDLAWLSTHSGNREVVEFLNTVVQHAYATIYRRPALRAGYVLRLALWRAADTTRRRAAFLLSAIVLFFAMTMFVSWVMQTQPELRTHFVDPMYEPLFDEWKKGEHPPRTLGEAIFATFGYAQHNPLLALVYMAVGPLTLGLASLYFLWMNSAMIGALATDMAGVGQLDFLLISISPHGITEIGGIMFSVAGGFLAGWAMLSPGRESRGESLRRVAPDVLTFTLIGFAMTMLAAPIEGFLSFNPAVPDFLKVAIATISLLFWIVFYAGFGRGPEPAPE